MHPLQPNTAYHIYNHANGFENIFRETENFRFFLAKYQVHMEPIAETFAYCLMPNHFHVVIKIRDRKTIENLMLAKRGISNSILPFPKFAKFETLGKVEKIELEKEPPTFSDKEIELFLSKQFANLFSSYTQAFNKVYHRIGSMFIKNFKREPINDHRYLLQAIVYTHRNPVHHHFCNSYEYWHSSSYNAIVDNSPSIVDFKKVIDLFGDLHNFLISHTESLNKFLDID